MSKVLGLNICYSFFPKLYIYRWRHLYHLKCFSTGANLVESAFYYFISLADRRNYKHTVFCEACFEHKK